MSANESYYCSFCGKSQHEVRKMISGPRQFICDECIELCMVIIHEGDAKKIEKPSADIELAMALTMPNITRVEVIDHGDGFEGRVFSRWSLTEVALSTQDDGRTLKIFCKSVPVTKPGF